MPGPYQVYSLAPDGTTYMGLITREDSWEMTGQQMPIPFRKGECYDVSLWLARAVSGYSGYNGATRLRVWAGNSMCDKQQLLFESQTIEHREFKKYHFYFWTKEAYKFILFEAYYKKDYTTPYNGNILVDGVSAFKPCLRANDNDEQEGYWPTKPNYDLWFMIYDLWFLIYELRFMTYW